MKKLHILILTALLTCVVQGVELHTLEHKVLHDERTYVRDSADRRYSVWTYDQAKAIILLKEFGFVVPEFQLQKGQILAVFFNDRITQDLCNVTYNKTAHDTFADYADSGIKFKLIPLGEGKKYSHATVVVFTPADAPSHLGIRDQVAGGLSDKQ